jgi:hypothetical protein
VTCSSLMMTTGKDNDRPDIVHIEGDDPRSVFDEEVNE